MERYLWLSARDRLNVLLKIAGRALFWLCATVVFAFALYLSPLKEIQNSSFCFLVMLLASFTLFVIVLKFCKTEQKYTLPLTLRICAAAGIIIFWVFLRYGPALTLSFLCTAIVLFGLSIFLALRFHEKIGSLRLGRKAIPIIVCAIFAEFAFTIYGSDKNAFILSGGLSLCFVLFCIVEINHINIRLMRYGIEEKELEQLIKQNVFPFYFNLLGMIVFSDGVRLICKLQLLKTKQQLLP